eukprot:g2107.t1
MDASRREGRRKSKESETNQKEASWETESKKAWTDACEDQKVGAIEAKRTIEEEPTVPPLPVVTACTELLKAAKPTSIHGKATPSEQTSDINHNFPKLPKKTQEQRLSPRLHPSQRRSPQSHPSQR